MRQMTPRGGASLAVNPDKLNAFTGKAVGDIGAAKHVKKTLAPDGTWMIVEPPANDRVEDNLNPMGRVFYAASTMICVPGI
jgi:hypothetical protein